MEEEKTAMQIAIEFAAKTFNDDSISVDVAIARVRKKLSELKSTTEREQLINARKQFHPMMDQQDAENWYNETYGSHE